MGPYDDILKAARPVVPGHPPMPRADRAKQFMPFASLRGFDDEIEERQVIPESRHVLSEDERAALDEQLYALQARLDAGSHPQVTLMLFTPDGDGDALTGTYREVTGMLRRIRLDVRAIDVDGTRYPLDRVDGIQSAD